MPFEIEFLKFLETLPPKEVSGLTAFADEKNIRSELVKLVHPDVPFERSCEVLKVINEIFKNATTSGKGMNRPQIFRQAVYFVIYREMLRRYVDGQEKADIEKEVINKAGLLETMYRKWRITPAYDFEMDLHNPAMWKKSDFVFWGINPNAYHYKYYDGVELNVERAGKKRKQLIYMINCLILQTHPKCVIDVFGGTGTVTTSMPCVKKQYLNEYDKVVYNFIEMVKYHSSIVLRYAREINEEIRNIKKSDERFINGEKIFLEQKETYQYRAKTVKNLKVFFCKLLGFWNDLNQKFSNGYFEKILTSNVCTEDKCKIAAYWYFVNHKEFKIKEAVSGTSLSGVDFLPYIGYLYSLGYKRCIGERDIYCFKIDDKDSDIRFLRKLNRQDFTQKDVFQNNRKIALLRYAEKLKKVLLLSEDFRDVFKITKVERDAVLYIDVPYFLTVQYNCVFPDSFHVELLDMLKLYHGKWIFSCKMKATNKKPNERARRGEGGSIIKGNMKDYFRGFLYDFDECKGVYSINTSRKIREETELYVLLSGEQEAYSEIMITNFDFTPPTEPEDYVSVMGERNDFCSTGVVSKKVGFGRFLEAVERGETYNELWNSVK